MEATIFKNDEFQTVGFKVKHADVIIFTWGLTSGFNTYSKTINADKYTADIMQLVHLQQMVTYYESTYVHQSFDILMHDNADRWEGSQFAEKGINFKKIDSTKDAHKKQMEDIINNIK